MQDLQQEHWKNVIYYYKLDSITFFLKIYPLRVLHVRASALTPGLWTPPLLV